MGKVDISVKELVEMIERGELRLPEMQRRYVWRATRVRDLLDSLYRSYPSGSILVWESEIEQPSREMAVSQKTNPFSGHKLLLDGQQRLTSLSAVIRGGSVKVRNRKKPIEILFNLDHPENVTEYAEVDSDTDSLSRSEDEIEEFDEAEEGDQLSIQERMKQMTFVVASRALAQQPNWVPVTKIFGSDSDTDLLKNAGVNSFDDPRYEKYSSRIKKIKQIKDYQYTMHVLSKDLNYEEVAEIFVRVNSLGVKLRGSDLALAQITARWPNSLQLLEEFQAECEESEMTLDLGLLVRAMVVFTTDQSRFDKVTAIPIEKLKAGWEKAKDGIRYAINFLRTNADIEDEVLLSSPLFFIVIAYYSYVKKENISSAEEKELLYWLYIANARGRYSRGSTESLLDADLNIMKKGSGIKDLIANVKQQFGRLTIEPEDFVGRGAASPLFSLVFLALKAKGAKDWQTGLGLSLLHQGRTHLIQYHHIFPKSLLKERYEKGEINEIANMAFIAGRTNRRISNKEPKEYLADVIKEKGRAVIEKQNVPLEDRFLEIDNYREFLNARRQMLSAAVNEFINTATQ